MQLGFEAGGKYKINFESPFSDRCFLSQPLNNISNILGHFCIYLFIPLIIYINYIYTEKYEHNQ